MGMVLFASAGVESLSEMEMGPGGISFRHADDVCPEGRYAGEIIAVVFPGGCIREALDVLEKDAYC